MVKSIRWRLQLWYALILLLVVAGFASVLYYQIGRARLDEIDAELHAAARALEGTLRALPPQLIEPNHPPKLGPRKGPRFPPSDHLLRELKLPPQLREREEGGPGLYFAIWRQDGRMMRSSPMHYPPRFPTWVPPPDAPPFVRKQEVFRELILAGPHGTIVLVGRDVAGEQSALTALGWTLLLTGSGVWAVGLAGGWVLSSRLLRPIETITATAATISAGSLSRRFDIAEVDSELGKLATVLNATFARLEGAFAQQTRFTADASHELRTPLAVLLSQVELTLARPRSSEDYREALEACGRASTRMKHLVEALLSLARADGGQPRPEHTPLDLGAIVRDTVGLVEPLAEERGIRLEADMPETWVQGDSSRLAQVVLNLLTNAIHYNRDGGRVEVRLERHDDTILLSVADTGCGIPVEDQDHIFERFYRVDRARSRELGGCGLGLAICKSIVDAHEGSIGFTSQPGEGTTFVVRLHRAARS